MKKISVLTVLILLTFACSKKIDQEIYDEISSSNFTYFQNGATLSPLGGSPHGNFKLKFNQIAQDALDGIGELPVGGTFPEGSVLVKEAYNSNGDLTLYVVMKKDSDNENAALGWLWAEYDPSGNTVISVADKGAACTGCHNTSLNRDYVKTFDLH